VEEKHPNYLLGFALPGSLRPAARRPTGRGTDGGTARTGGGRGYIPTRPPAVLCVFALLLTPNIAHWLMALDAEALSPFFTFVCLGTAAWDVSASRPRLLEYPQGGRLTHPAPLSIFHSAEPPRPIAVILVGSAPPRWGRVCACEAPV
jgi:hypothetical protein